MNVNSVGSVPGDPVSPTSAIPPRPLQHVRTRLLRLDTGRSVNVGYLIEPEHQGGRFHVTVEDSFIGAVAGALGVARLHVVETGGDEYRRERDGCPPAPGQTAGRSRGLLISGWERM
jgi:hypothetical protein